MVVQSSIAIAVSISVKAFLYALNKCRVQITSYFEFVSVLSALTLYEQLVNGFAISLLKKFIQIKRKLR